MVPDCFRSFLRSSITLLALALWCGPAGAQDAVEGTPPEAPPEEAPPAEQAPPEEQPPAPEQPPPPQEAQPVAPSEPEPEPEPERRYERDEPRTVVVHVDREDDDDEEEAEPEQNPFDPHEREGDKLYHFGVFGRAIFVPQYGQNFFVAGGNDAIRPSAGAFFNFRQDNLNFMVEVSWANFFNTAAYHGINETDFETEWIESELSVLFVSLVLMYSIPITSWLAFEIGGALGLGGVFGNLWRTEAYPDPGAEAGWTPCARPYDPNDPAGYCDTPDVEGGEGSYQRYYNQPEPYNFAGGVPPLWFWLELPRIAIRFKPIRYFQIRVEAGFAVYGFQAGASAAIGF